MPTREDVARLAGVSGATVSRVFNNPALVGAETCARVRRAAAELAYQPNQLASNFVRGRSGNLGVIVPHLPKVHLFSSYYFAELLSGIGETAREQGYDLLLIHHPAAEEDGDYRRYFSSGKIDAGILLGTRSDDKSLAALLDTGQLFCLINNYIDDPRLSFVDVDNVTGAMQAVEHLIGLGHRRIGFLNGPLYMINSIDRLAGYRFALRRHGISVADGRVLQGDYGRRSGISAAVSIAGLDDRPTAVFAANDRMASGLIQGLRERNLRVPEDLSVVGYDDGDLAVHVDPPLTTVHVPFYEIGRLAAGRLLSRLAGHESGPFQLRLPVSLVVRSSTGPVQESPHTAWLSEQ